MEIKVENWLISKFTALKDKINNQPEYQRGEVWNDKKKMLLIDSILRGIDIPKIYLRVMKNGTYEVADGQQRLTALRKFLDDKIEVPSSEEKGLKLGIYNGVDLRGKTFDELPKIFKQSIRNYNLTIALVENASGDEIRTLFGRLQEGVNLNTAEKRNAILSPIGRHIDNYIFNHSFFLDSKISKSRFKRQDFLAHVFALIAYNNKEELKAVLIEKLYLDGRFTLDQSLMDKISTVLDYLARLDKFVKTRIYKKFHFIDLFWFLYKEFSKITKIDYDKFAKKFDDFEFKRLSVVDPKELINKNKSTHEERDLYDYVMAFKYNGSSVESINTRSRIFHKLFSEYL